MPHLLKRLELNGFKSFPQKTVLEFPRGITAIVGPNGSGKSNVIDAIRWLLGEREAKNLRGGKVEDLIFAGTSKRARISQAQASLHFDNSSKFFPVDFSEVAVSREVRRDGLSRYFLNKAEVRLKDLVDFFARARLGAQGLTVVTQGNSDVFIRSAPRERREMIEEILGLREYQLKKSEAERRLKNTQINLDKAKALLEEILPHLRSLKRQTGRFEKRGVIEEELKELENRFFGSEYREIKSGLDQIGQELKSHQDEFIRLKKEKETAEKHLSKVEAGQPKERKELEEIKQKIVSFLDKRGELQKKLGRLEAQLELAGKKSKTFAASVPAAFVEKIKSKLELLLERDTDVHYEDMRDAVREIIDDINEVISGRITDGEPSFDISSSLESDLKAIQSELTHVEKELTILKEREQTFEKHQEDFLADFKSAVHAFETTKDALEQWEGANQKRLFQKERLTLRYEEWERQVRAAGRAPQEFFSPPLHEPLETGEREAAEKRMFRLRGELHAIGDVDEALLKEAGETEERHRFLEQESKDLDKAKGDLHGIIADLKERIEGEFGGALSKISEEFNKFFGLMFGGGAAKLKIQSPKPKIQPVLSEDEEKTKIKEEDAEKEEEELGIEIDLKLPRKRLASLDMLSGGERSLVGIAALFALISVSPPPFLVLDEVDAALDERNSRRFSEMLKEFSKQTQFVIVTHNRATMEAADILYGVTLAEDETSKVVSLRLE